MNHRRSAVTLFLGFVVFLGSVDASFYPERPNVKLLRHSNGRRRLQRDGPNKTQKGVPNEDAPTIPPSATPLATPAPSRPGLSPGPTVAPTESSSATPSASLPASTATIGPSLVATVSPSERSPQTPAASSTSPPTVPTGSTTTKPTLLVQQTAMPTFEVVIVDDTPTLSPLGNRLDNLDVTVRDIATERTTLALRIAGSAILACFLVTIIFGLIRKKDAKVDQVGENVDDDDESDDESD